MILVYAHNAWGCSRSWKSALVCALLLCDRCAEMLPNIRGSRPRDNANIDVIDHVHGRSNVFAEGSDNTRSCVYIRRSGLSCVMRGRSLVVQYVTRNMIL